MSATIHELKNWPTYFQATLDGKKRFELRKNDRDYKVGDILHLREFVLEQNWYTDREFWVRVTYILEHGEWLTSGYICMSIEPIEPPEQE
jgi:hypothetical protein